MFKIKNKSEIKYETKRRRLVHDTKRTVPLVSRVLSFVLIFSIILPILGGPIGGVFAQSGNMITYTYKRGIGNENELESIFMSINTNINTAGIHDVTIITDEGSPQNIGRITVEERDVNRDIVRNFWINNPRTNMRINKIIIGNFRLDLDFIGIVGKISEMETYDINIGDNISFKGERLDQGTINISGESSFNQERTADRFVQQMNGTTGYKNITLKLDDGNTSQTAVYPNAFKLLGDIPNWRYNRNHS